MTPFSITLYILSVESQDGLFVSLSIALSSKEVEAETAHLEYTQNGFFQLE
jgi:hypothetical protein